MTTTKKDEVPPLAVVLGALQAAMRQVGYVQKDKTNDFHRYSYASEEGLLKALRPALVENGILLIPSLEGQPTIDEHGNTHLVEEYTLAHVSGALWPDKIRVPGCGNDRAKNGTIGDKGVYKALTGANKYLLFKLFQIATGDDPEVTSDHDKGSDSQEPPKPTPTSPAPNPAAAKAMQIKSIMEKCGTTEAIDQVLAENATHIEAMSTDYQDRLKQYAEAFKGALMVGAG